ncbi:MAG: hypothetical protein ACRDH9_02475 [Actinomycetota bacterium]
MSPIWPALTFVGAAILAIVRLRRPAEDPVLRENYSGAVVPVTLGQALVFSAQGAAASSIGLAALAGPVPEWPIPLLLLLGALILFAVGRLDDGREDGPRGLHGHVGSLLRGRATTGILKLAMGVLTAAVLAMELGGGSARVIVATLVIALSVNVTNALDVRPGRSLKWALLILVPVCAAAWGQGVILVALAYIAAGLVVLRSDLREAGMLGDAGSNPLGLVVGTSLAAVLPTVGLIVALVLLLGLQVAAETVTISRLIEGAPPLRWLDALGRRT